MKADVFLGLLGFVFLEAALAAAELIGIILEEAFAPPDDRRPGNPAGG